MILKFIFLFGITFLFVNISNAQNEIKFSAYSYNSNLLNSRRFGNCEDTLPFSSVINNSCTDEDTSKSAIGSIETADEKKYIVFSHPESIFTYLWSDWKSWGNDFFSADNLAAVAAVTASTAVLLRYDNELWKPLDKEYKKNGAFKKLTDVFVFAGDGKFQFGLAAGFGLYGVVTGNDKAVQCASQITEVILAAGGVVQLIKHVTGRERPEQMSSPTGNWNFFPNQISYHKNVAKYDAFPSGHFATALATFTVITENYPEQKWIKIIGYPALALVTSSLVAKGMHWWSDFPLSLVIGYSFGKIVSARYNNALSVTQKQLVPHISFSCYKDVQQINLTWGL